ncbi:MAG: transcription-repair coupling factor, partial [Lachnospiraceae bacterium]|nr:transcription-repair coupling factor [Lachnospiraceae bacterium]
YTESAPYRIDLWGDEVESIKLFDVESQRSIESVEEFTIFPAVSEQPSEEGEKAADGLTDQVDLFAYFDEKTLFVLDEPAKIFSEAVFEERLLSEFQKRNCLQFSMLGSGYEELPTKTTVHINARNIPSYNGRFEDLANDLKQYRRDGWNVTLFTASNLRAERLIKELQEKGVEPNVQVGAVRTGFAYPNQKFAIISEVDIFGVRRAKKRKRKRFSGDPIKDFTDLNIGDYVVHEQHGVGIYRGIERITVDGTEKDYMKIDYAGNSSLYVLATQFDKIQKYAGSDGAKPKIHKLGSKEWNNTKSRVRASVKDIAAELVALYAERQNSQGYKYMPDTVWQQEFEEQFEFEETDDQLRAVDAVKADMESTKIMDRLICGDVGFGKTEVALRAAFKAVQEGKQVAFLCPTTILTQQHYNTIVNRMRGYPITVAQLSRFSSGKQQKETVSEIKKGMVDIVVGTHRLLSKDIEFKDLGLLIVDEEQRFGVSHKEKIKQLRKNVDVLTLSATPIPRTLHMSLSGIRDMSLLTEPPVDRVPIQTYVMEYSDDAVREAILREARRGGQVYYVYNLTNSIDTIAAKIQNMVPDLNVQYAHGKMAAKTLEGIMEDFTAGDIDVLVSTTIIETGMDISNVNTIIIHDADRFGLSQLYQLRGRVGRTNRTAYAFLMYRKDKLIREVAEKRLKAIREFSDLGSGIKIAMRDLEIRGAGNVLGAEQSGHMEAVGYELYCK